MTTCTSSLALASIPSASLTITATEYSSPATAATVGPRPAHRSSIWHPFRGLSSILRMRQDSTCCCPAAWSVRELHRRNELDPALRDHGDEHGPHCPTRRQCYR